jgi:hypothetical protein
MEVVRVWFVKNRILAALAPRITAVLYFQLRRIFCEVLPAIFGKSGQLPARDKKAFNRRADGFASETVNPPAIFTSFTVPDLTQKAFGKRIAWTRP